MDAAKRLLVERIVLEVSFQYKRKPARCQRNTVSGVTTMRACFHPDQNRLTATQNSLSNGLGHGRRRRRYNTASRWRNARFSRRRLRRTRKKLTSIPRQRPTKQRATAAGERRRVRPDLIYEIFSDRIPDLLRFLVLGLLLCSMLSLDLLVFRKLFWGQDLLEARVLLLHELFILLLNLRRSLVSRLCL